MTFNNSKAAEDWFSVTAPRRVEINGVVFAHGHSFHDGGWFDSSRGTHKPQVQVQTEKGVAWKTVATLDEYPVTTAQDPAGLKDGQKFVARFQPVSVVAIRVVGVPASGDNPAQNFSSCAELKAFLDRK